MNNELFEELFVLELANNHWGSIERGLKIIDAYAKVIKDNGVRAAIKLQFRDGDHFIHPDFIDRDDIRYIKKTRQTALGFADLSILVKAIRDHGLMAMATPFDEESVRWCDLLDLPIIKIASSDINDWPLLNAIATLQKPVICSAGGATFEQVDKMVAFFEARDIPLAINHCVSLYPSEDDQLELDQIDLYKKRYPDHVIGFSSHEYHDWQTSIAIAYAKGARSFERHIDIDLGDYAVSPYCSLPEQIDTWFKSYNKTRQMCGHVGKPRDISNEEVAYLDKLVRGVYAKRDLPAGHEFNPHTILEDVYLAIPWQEGQLSCRDLGELNVLDEAVAKDKAISVSASSVKAPEPVEGS